MCIQQPQDSSQISAVIAHYNQSSWAHLGSPFGILHWEKHKTKPQIPPQLCVLHKPLQQEQNERMGLCDRGFPQRMARHRDRAGCRWRHSLLLWVHQSCPGSQPEQRQHTGAGVSCRLSAFPTSPGSQQPSWEPCHGSRGQEQSQSKEKQSAKKEMGVLRRRSGLRLRKMPS